MAVDGIPHALKGVDHVENLEGGAGSEELRRTVDQHGVGLAYLAGLENLVEDATKLGDVLGVL